MKTREQLEATGNKILNSVRTELYLSMRFMGPALGSLGFAMDLSTRTVGTDAVYIRFNPTYLLQTYIERPEILNRTYMHMLMHCLFRHMFSAKQHEDAQLWDLCCDIAVESVVDSMDYPTILRVTSDFRQEWYEKLEKEVSVLTAEKLYQYFMLRKRDPYLEESLRQEFLLCDHSFWQRMEKEPSQEQNKTSPRCRRRIRRWTVISRKMPGRKRLMQRRLENRSKGRRVERTCKAYRKRYGNLCKRRGGRCGKACMDVKAEQPGAKKLQRIFKEVCSCERRGFRGYGFV